MRPDRDAWHQRGTDWLAEMADCRKRKVGALIVGPDKRLWGMGYNGGRPGGPSCLDGECPRGRHYEVKGQCTCRNDYGDHETVEQRRACRRALPSYCGHGTPWDAPWPCPDAVPPGSSYDTGPGLCIDTHAEMNAADDAKQRGGGRLAGCIMHVNAMPCEGCLRYLRNQTDIEAVMWKDGNQEGIVALP